MKSLNITLVQSQIIWEDRASSIAHFEHHLQKISATDLIVLPEMFTTGFSMNPAKIAEEMEGKSMQWMATIAKEKEAVITGSLIIAEKGVFYNRLIWMRPDGSYEFYNKRHLFTLAGEHEQYELGKERLIVDINGWKVCPLICYDLRFPVWSRNTVNYDLLLYVANWPNKRSNAWKSLLTARAIENQSYTIGVNRVGEDANQLAYQGDTGVIDYAGEQIARLTSIEGILQVELNYEQQQIFRKKLAFLADRDEFKIY